ncbi:MAG: CRISPR system precrRNA processing endoribonuclease RAMP protein Cas6 [Candidatus Obscuribacterales bacterium]|nr:CRISPR system precrRNA processing endoribonuclease RAMP protein Cas6 [Candidatus Obscuribacterales bacterium]
MKIEKYVLNLHVDEDRDPFLKSPSRGALMHGVLMNSIDSSSLHQGSAPRPFSQNLLWNSPGEYLWTINLLHEEGCSSIKHWLERVPSCIEIEHYESQMEVRNVSCVLSTCYEQLLAEVFAELPPKYVTFDFLSPLIFKKAGVKSPWPYPEARMILQSVLGRWNQFSDVANFGDETIFEDAAQQIAPHSLRIHTQRVSMDATSFAGAIGTASFLVLKSELRQLMNLAGRFAEFSGVGAKTAMGLGAVRFEASLETKKRPKKEMEV